MDFDRKYKHSNQKEYYKKDLKKLKDYEDCYICNELTRWKYYWKKTDGIIKKSFSRFICSEECLEYYKIMKEIIEK